MDDFVSGCKCKLLLLINWLILLFMDDPLWHSNSLHTYPTNVSIVDVLKIKQESRVFLKSYMFYLFKACYIQFKEFHHVISHWEDNNEANKNFVFQRLLRILKILRNLRIKVFPLFHNGTKQVTVFNQNKLCIFIL